MARPGLQSLTISAGMPAITTAVAANRSGASQASRNAIMPPVETPAT